MKSSSQFSVVSSQKNPGAGFSVSGLLELRTENSELRASFSLPCYGDRSGDQIHQRQRQQELPAKRHQLVIAEARQRAAHPDVQKEKCNNLGGEPEHGQKCLQNWRAEDRPMPSAEK